MAKKNLPSKIIQRRIALVVALESWKLRVWKRNKDNEVGFGGGETRKMAALNIEDSQRSKN